jgi:hypothetical protein
MNKVVYIHVRNDSNTIFYVGIGSKERAKSKAGRNSWWQRIVNKTSFSVYFLHENLTSQEAKKIEIDLITKYKLMGIELCNLTNGGDGRLGGTQSEEWKKTHSNFLKGNNYSLGKPFKEPIIGIDLKSNNIIKFNGKKSIENDGRFVARQVYRCANKDKICKSYSMGIYKNFQFFWESEYLRKAG